MALNNSNNVLMQAGNNRQVCIVCGSVDFEFIGYQWWPFTVASKEGWVIHHVKSGPLEMAAVSMFACSKCGNGCQIPTAGFQCGEAVAFA